MSRLPITTDPEWLHNAHAGDLLASEFLEPLEMSADNLADVIGVAHADVRAVIAGASRVTGELDLRLCRYFRLSDGFFLRLQDRYELLEAKRTLNGALDRIVPRAA